MGWINSKALDSDQQRIRPLRLLQENLIEFPLQLIQASQDSKLLLLIADRLQKVDFLLGQAVLVLWEAIVRRIAEAYHKDFEGLSKKKRFDVHLTLSAIATDARLKQLGVAFQDFKKNVAHLKRIRNAIAHVVQDDNFVPPTPSELRDDFNSLFIYFKFRLQQDALDRLPNFINFDSKTPSHRRPKPKKEALKIKD